MTVELTDAARASLNAATIKPNLVVEIDGIDFVFGAVAVKRYAKWGDDIQWGDAGLIWGGLIDDPTSKTYIDLDGSNKQITQQIDIDKAGGASVGHFNVALIDKDSELTELFQPGAAVPDILGRGVTIYLAFETASHPDDSVRIFSGVIDNVSFNAGLCMLSIAHPEQLKRRELFLLPVKKLTGNITASATTISIDDATDLFETTDILTQYIKIADEVIKVGAISGNDLTGCTRAQLGTIAASAVIDDECEPYYTLSAQPIEMALKIMLSSSTEYFVEDVAIARFVYTDDGDQVTNAVVFEGIDVEEKYNLRAGDFFTITGATNSANNITLRAIASFGTIGGGSYAVLEGAALTPELESSAVVKIKSKYNTLPEGCGIDPTFIDIDQFESIEDTFSASFTTFTIKVKESFEAKEFIEDKIFFPSGLKSIPRKGRISIAYTAPPLSDIETIILDQSNIEDPASIKISRSTNKFHYNTVVYKYDEDAVEDKFYETRVTTSDASQVRINMGVAPLKIDAPGLASGATAETFIDRQSTRYLDQFKFAAEHFDVKVNFSTGIQIEAGDAIVFDGAGLNISDSKKGTRNFGPRIMQVANVKKDLSGKTATGLSLVDTAYGTNGRYGRISPSSKLAAGSTTTTLILKASYGSTDAIAERRKWERFAGQRLRIRSADFSFDETATIRYMDSSNPKAIVLTTATALSLAPSEDYIIQVPVYDDTDSDTDALYKTLYTFLTPRITVTGGTSGTVFTVGVGDVAKFQVGKPVIVFSSDHSVTSDEVNVSTIVGTTITVDSTLGFTPLNGYLVDLVGFQDGGEPYRLV